MTLDSQSQISELIEHTEIQSELETTDISTELLQQTVVDVQFAVTDEVTQLLEHGTADIQLTVNETTVELLEHASGGDVLEVSSERGPQGPPGPQGPTGPSGPPGDTTDALAYVHVQGVPAAIWTIGHMLGWNPKATVIDSGGTVVEGDMTYIDSNTLTLNFASAFSGKAYLS